MMRDVSVIVTSISSADVTFVGRVDLPSPTIGSSKFSAEITTGRVESLVVAGAFAATVVDAVVCDVVSVVAEFDEHAEIAVTKSEVVNKVSADFLVTIAISIY